MDDYCNDEGWQQFRATRAVLADLHTEAVRTGNPLAAKLDAQAVNVAAARYMRAMQPQVPPVQEREWDEAFEGARRA